jgi:four helix bundle protein
MISSGSASELDYHLLLAHDLGYLDGARYDNLRTSLNEVRRMLTAMIKTSRSTQKVTTNNHRPAN